MTAPERLCATCGRDIRHRGDRVIYCHKSCAEKAKRRRARNRNMLGKVAPPPPPTHCIPCGKVACTTEEAAKVAKRAVEIARGRTNEVRYYRCPEGWWHWTRLDATLDGFRARGGVA